jgi:hypothetical protein
MVVDESHGRVMGMDRQLSSTMSVPQCVSILMRGNESD